MQEMTVTGSVRAWIFGRVSSGRIGLIVARQDWLLIRSFAEFVGEDTHVTEIVWSDVEVWAESLGLPVPEWLARLAVARRWLDWVDTCRSSDRAGWCPGGGGALRPVA